MNQGPHGPEIWALSSTESFSRVLRSIGGVACAYYGFGPIGN
jgi:hypothetical protein